MVNRGMAINTQGHGSRYQGLQSGDLEAFCEFDGLLWGFISVPAHWHQDLGIQGLADAWITFCYQFQFNGLNALPR